MVQLSRRGTTIPLLVAVLALSFAADALAPASAVGGTVAPLSARTTSVQLSDDAAVVRPSQAETTSFPKARWYHLKGRVQKCSWRYTELNGTVCRNRSVFKSAKIRYFGFPPSKKIPPTPPSRVSVWNKHTRAWQQGPYRLDKPTRTVWLDGSLVSQWWPPQVGRARRAWIDQCKFWLYVPSRGTHCQLGKTVRVRAKGTATGGVKVRRANGRYKRLPGYTWRSTGKGFYALDAAKLGRPRSHPRPVLPALPSGDPRIGSAKSFEVLVGGKNTVTGGITRSAALGRSWCTWTMPVLLPPGTRRPPRLPCDRCHGRGGFGIGISMGPRIPCSHGAREGHLPTLRNREEVALPDLVPGQRDAHRIRHYQGAGLRQR